MMKPADASLGLNLDCCGRVALDLSPGRCRLLQGEVYSVLVIIRQILAPSRIWCSFSGMM